MHAFSRFLATLVLLLPALLQAQVVLTDNFSDGDFTSNPAWTGEAVNFTVNGSNELQTNGPAASDTAYLSTPFTFNAAETFVWDFYLKLDFSPSNSNNARIFLLADQSDIEGALNGYFIRIGENGSTDRMKLYKQQGTTTTLLATGAVSTFDAAPEATFRVVRDPAGNWELYSDTLAGTNYTLEASVTNTDILTGGHFGLFMKYTGANSTAFTFDDLTVTQQAFVDTVAPTVDTLMITGNNTLKLVFSEPLNPADAQTASNYTSTLLGNPATATLTQDTCVELTFGAAFVFGINDTLVVANITDTAANAMQTDSLPFYIDFPGVALPGAVVINELFADPTPVVALPGGEYVELYNTSGTPYQLNGWQLVNTTTVMTLGSFVLEPDSFLILCANSDTSNYQPLGATMGLSGWAALTNGGDSLTLIDGGSTVLDIVSYDIAWYNDAVKDDGGWSLELINPTPGPCLATTAANWTASNDATGGTPGTQNSVWDTVPETIAPELLSVSVDGTNQLTLTFNEVMDSTSLANGSYMVDNGLSVTAVSVLVGLTQVQLLLNPTIDTGIVYTITVTGVTDCPGNAIAGNNTQQFVITAPAQPGAVVINEIFADPTPIVALPDAEFVELHNTTSSPVQLDGWQLVNTTTVMTLSSFVLEADSFLILCANADTSNFQPFGATMGLSSWAALTNGGDSLTLLDTSGAIIDLVSYDISWYNDAVKDDGGWSLELINPTPGNCNANASTNWTASNNAAGGTPGAQNSVWDTLPDATAPLFTAVMPVTADNILLQFNEPMDATSLANGTYTIDNGLSVVGVAVSSDLMSVTLGLSLPIDSGVVYTITVTGVTDCPGNAIAAASAQTFTVVGEPSPGDVIFTEIMADPTPVVALPNQEFIELYNTGSQTFDLSGCTFEGVAFPAGASIAPQQYVIVCDDGDSAAFASYGTLILLGSFPSLTNGGEDLVLANSSGQLIDSLFYDLSWYNDAIKADGGWTLELINPQNPCSDDPAANWTASNNADGGTPGMQNSVFDTLPDLSAPELLSATLVGQAQVLLQFSEVMDTVSLQNGTYTVDNGFIVTGAAVASSSSVLITLNVAPDTGTTYTITVAAVNDCSGNAIGSANTATLLIGFLPLPGEIVINEIFADPSPAVALPEEEFVELLNTTNKLFELGGAQLSGSSIPAGTQLQPNGYLILCAAADTALFTPYGNTAGLSSWNALTNGGETIELRGPDSTLVDAVSYDISWYNNPSKDDGGWTLERINPETPCSSAANWTASIDNTGGTPGQQNSVYDNTPDTQVPTLANVVVISANSVQLQFNEPMDSTSLANGSYAVDNGLAISSAVVDSSAFSTVLLTFTTDIDTAVLYSVTVNGPTDCPGNALAANTQRTFIIGYVPLHGEVVINEIMADPTPVVGLPEAEYIELFNTGNRLLDLSGATIEGAALPAGTLLDPNGYLLLVDSADVNDFIGGTAVDNWNSLTNDGEDLVLALGNGQLIDSLTYDISWYADPALDGGGYSLERVNPFTDCSFANNWRACQDPFGGTPLLQNSVYSTAPDTIAPSLVSATVIDANEVLLTFSEGMDSTSLANGAYAFSNSIFTQDVEVQANLTQVLITLNNTLDTAIWYTATVSGMTDCGGLPMGTPDTAAFVIGYRPEPGDVFFNEMMLDPTPPVGLPEEEYIEIFNTTSRLLDLSECTYDGANFPANTFIEPNGYLILADDEAAEQFEPHGRVAAIGSWQTLTNAGEEIVLAISNGPVLDRVAYTDAWYNDPSKEAGGWSLERVNPFTDCNYSNNWRASVADSGGTPGAINSVYSIAPDTIPPAVSGVTVITDAVIMVHFTETMDSLSLTTGIYTLSPSIPVFAYVLDSIDFNHIELRLNGNLDPGVVYTVFADGVLDCEGNPIGSPNAWDFVLPEQGTGGDLIINEVLFNPVTGGSDFVEVYNNSTKNIDLAGWKLANYDAEDDTIANIKTITEEQYILSPGEYATLTKDQTLWFVYRAGTFTLEAFDSDLKDQYPDAVVSTFINMSSMPTYANDEGTVILINNLDSVMDRFDYQDDYHYPLLNSDDGVSLERIDFNRPTNDATNWHSASESVNFATPGYENSQFQPTEIVDGEITVEPEIFSPDNDGYNDVVHINYRFDAPGFSGSVEIYDANGRLIRKLMNNELLGPEGTISWDGISDDNEKARIGIYIIYFEAFDLDGKVLKFKEKCVLGGMIGN